MGSRAASQEIKWTKPRRGRYKCNVEESFATQNNIPLFCKTLEKEFELGVFFNCALISNIGDFFLRSDSVLDGK
ncbi:hypothetical protein P8452_64550 [Trifolium repens]|nr:hypothetical protein P8452_64550 [Trifolium repens]